MNLLQNTKSATIYSGVDGATSTTEKLKALYDKSGSTKTFSDWLNDLKSSQNKKGTPVIDWLQSDSAKQALATAQNLVNKYNDAKHGSDTTPTVEDTKGAGASNGFGETTILGMTPITFGVVASLVLVGGFLGFRYIVNNKIIK
jgi:hypothetical protein